MKHTPKPTGSKDLGAPILSLFTASGTLLCCALPALLSSVGLGSVMIGLVAAAPWLVTLSRYKLWVFTVSGLLIVLTLVVQYRGRNRPCPIDPAKAKACKRLRKISAAITYISAFFWGIGFTVAFILPKILY